MGWQHLKIDYAMSAGIMSVENILEIVLKLWSTKNLRNEFSNIWIFKNALILAQKRLMMRQL